MLAIRSIRMLVCASVASLVFLGGCSTESDDQYTDFDSLSFDASHVAEEESPASLDARTSPPKIVPTSTAHVEQAASDDSKVTHRRSEPQLADSSAEDESPVTPVTATEDSQAIPQAAGVVQAVSESSPVVPSAQQRERPGVPDGANSALAATEKREIRLLIPDNDFQWDTVANALRVTYDDIDLLQILNMDPVTTDATDHFPDWLRALDGKEIAIRGFMYPTFSESGIERFMLARDNDICCFVRQPKLYDVIRVSLKSGTATDYIEGYPFDVIGTFAIRPAVDDGDIYELFHIDDARIVNKR